MKRILFLIILWAFACVAEDSVYFVQLTDAHLGPEDNFERTRAAVEAINALPMDVAFVAVTGDIMQNSIGDSNVVKEARAIFSHLEMPVHFVPGNHDLLKKAPLKTVAAFTNSFGPLISSAEYGGVQFVFVCTEPLAGGVQIEGYDPLGELEPLLEDHPTVVFHHAPSADGFYKNTMHNGWGRSEIGRQWVELLNRHDVKAVIAGHFHRGEMYWLGDVPLYVCAPIAGKWGRQASFRIYEYSDGHLNYRTQYIQ